jgi:hypothetical protein
MAMRSDYICFQQLCDRHKHWCYVVVVWQQ